jgi:hypothetical protein
VLDRDAKFGTDGTDFLLSSRIKPKRIGFWSPWQNGTADRWIESCRRDVLAHGIPLSMNIISYYHVDRIHDSLDKDTPSKRPASHKADPTANLIPFPRIGGLHHRHDWEQAA